ncbi:MAG: hypothetical protein OHK0026_17930 [Rhodocyclaceae bacterium]
MQAIKNTLSALKLGEPAAHGRLAVFPLTGADAPGPDYLTLDEAVAAGVLRVTEVSLGGSVPELNVANSGSRPVLLLDGEQLVGAKQNRILNLSILVPAKAEITIPVSCVEAGRWDWRSETFAGSKSPAFAGLRAAKAAQVSASLAQRGARRADQRAVWDAVSKKMGRMNVASPTGAMNDVFERFDQEMHGFEAALPPTADQRGAIFAIGGRVAGLDLFDRAATFARVRDKLVRSYALDAIEGGEKDQPAEAGAAQRFLDALQIATVAHYPATGLGEDVRLDGLGLCGAALVVEDKLVHLCAFARPAGPHQAADAPMASWARRRHGLH